MLIDERITWCHIGRRYIDYLLINFLENWTRNYTRIVIRRHQTWPECEVSKLSRTEKLQIYLFFYVGYTKTQLILLECDELATNNARIGHRNIVNRLPWETWKVVFQAFKVFHYFSCAHTNQAATRVRMQNIVWSCAYVRPSVRSSSKRIQVSRLFIMQPFFI